MAQMRALDTPDPFNDDFYYHNAMRRKREKSLRGALMGQDPNTRVRARVVEFCVCVLCGSGGGCTGGFKMWPLVWEGRANTRELGWNLSTGVW